MVDRQQRSLKNFSAVFSCMHCYPWADVLKYANAEV